jgi:hypothetical protein
MKMGVFTHVHYCHADVLRGSHRPSLSLNKERETMQAFRDTNVSFVCILTL